MEADFITKYYPNGHQVKTDFISYALNQHIAYCVDSWILPFL